MCSAMKKISPFALIASLALISCSDPLDKKFNRESAEADFARIVKLKSIDSADAYIMSHFMVEHDLIGAQVLELDATYRDILKESQRFWNESHGKEKTTTNSTDVDKSASLTQDLAVSVNPVAGSVQQSEWSHGIKYTIMLENKSGKTIRAIKGNFVLYDAFGDKVNTIEYKYLEPLMAGEKVERPVTMRIQNVVSPQLILEYGQTNPFTVKWEPVSLIF
jgi:hypothetical protein